jgi:hypothetical protein
VGGGRVGSREWDDRSRMVVEKLKSNLAESPQELTW